MGHDNTRLAVGRPKREEQISMKQQQSYRLRFGIGTLLLFMVVVSVASAAASYLVQASQSPGWQRLVFILITLAAPVVLLVLMSLMHFASKWLNRR
jgi:cytochrome c oxidase subunit IV